VMESLRHAGLVQRLGRERLLPNARAVIVRFQQLPDGGPDAAAPAVA